MRGFPSRFKSKEDLEHGIEYALEHVPSKERMIKALENIRDSVKVRRLKEGVIPESEEEASAFIPTEDDFEMVDDPNAVYYKFGFEDGEVEQMIARLQ